MGLQYLKYDNQSLINRHTDGVDVGGNQLTKFYSRQQFRNLFAAFQNVNVAIDDNPSMPRLLPHPWIPLGRLLPASLNKWICQRFGLEALITAEK